MTCLIFHGRVSIKSFLVANFMPLFFLFNGFVKFNGFIFRFIEDDSKFNCTFFITPHFKCNVFRKHITLLSVGQKAIDAIWWSGIVIIPMLIRFERNKFVPVTEILARNSCKHRHSLKDQLRSYTHE